MVTPPQSVEDALRRAEQYAALLRYLADTTGTPIAPPEQIVLSGLAELCQEIESAVRSARRALPASALSTPLNV